MSDIAIINDNNNFAPSVFQSLCEFVGDCFGPRYFSSGATLPQKNTLGPKQSPLISHSDFRKDGAQLLLSKKSTLQLFESQKAVFSPKMLTLSHFENGCDIIDS